MSHYFCLLREQGLYELLVTGYFRENNPYITPIGLPKICLNFYDQETDCHHWKLEGDKLDEFFNCPHQQEISGPSFDLNGMKVTLEVYPNGFTHSTDGYVHFYFIIDRDTFPANIKDITIYSVFYLDEIAYENRYSETFNQSGYLSTMWYGYSVKAKTLKDMNVKQLNFACYLQILHINYKKDDKSDKSDDENDKIVIYSDNNDDKSDKNDYKSDKTDKKVGKNVMYSDPGDGYFTQNINMNTSTSFEWYLTGDELYRFKNCLTDFSLYSPNFNNNCFCIVTAPNGLTVVPNSDGYIYTKIKLIRLPFGVGAIECKCKLEMRSIKLNKNNKKHKYNYYKKKKYSVKGKVVYNNKQIEIFSYKSAGSNRKSDKWLRSSFAKSDKILINVKIEIINAFDNNLDVIPKSKWNKCGLIDNSNNKKNKNNNYNEDIISQLVVFGYGTRAECISASLQTIDYNNINDVMDKLNEMQSY